VKYRRELYLVGVTFSAKFFLVVMLFLCIEEFVVTFVVLIPQLVLLVRELIWIVCLEYPFLLQDVLVIPR
jgi:hypothetical protein